LLYHALAHPDATYSIEFHKNVYDVAYETARSDLLDLVEKGFLDKIQQGKTFYFIPKKDIAIKLKKL
jgi:Fic family protein